MQPATIIKILTDVTGVFGSTSQLHEILVEHQAQAIALIPVLQNLGEVPSALAAAEKAAPDLTAAIKGFVGATFSNGMPSPTGMRKAENLVRSIGGLGHMTAEQETAWMDRFTPQSSDSRSGSG